MTMDELLRIAFVVVVCPQIWLLLTAGFLAGGDIDWRDMTLGQYFKMATSGLIVSVLVGLMGLGIWSLINE